MSNCDSILPGPLTRASATAASRSVLVLKTRMAFTEPGIRPDWPSPNRSIQKKKNRTCQSTYIFSVPCEESWLLPLKTDTPTLPSQSELHGACLPEGRA